jgi:hypothetical protein
MGELVILRAGLDGNRLGHPPIYLITTTVFEIKMYTFLHAPFTL